MSRNLVGTQCPQGLRLIRSAAGPPYFSVTSLLLLRHFSVTSPSLKLPLRIRHGVGRGDGYIFISKFHCEIEKRRRPQAATFSFEDYRPLAKISWGKISWGKNKLGAFFSDRQILYVRPGKTSYLESLLRKNFDDEHSKIRREVWTHFFGPHLGQKLDFCAEKIEGPPTYFRERPVGVTG